MTFLCTLFVYGMLYLKAIFPVWLPILYNSYDSVYLIVMFVFSNFHISILECVKLSHS